MGSARFASELCRAALGEREGIAAMIKVFMDESGTHEGSPVVAVAAYCGRPRQWESWTRAWNAAKRPVNVFHSVDCQNLAGEFKGWTAEERDKLVVKALATLKGSQLFGLGVGINMKEFNVALAGKENLRPMLGTPYAACFHWVVSSILDLMDKTNNNQSIAFFHEENDYQGEALENFRILKDARKRHSSGMTITFAPKSKFAPLQAADVLAYEANKLGRNPKGTKRRSLQALGDRISIQGFGSDNIPWLVRRMESCAEEIKTFGRVVTFLPDEDDPLQHA